MGCVPPREGYLEFLRSITEQQGAVLIFDEVMTGFRLSFGGAQQLYKIKPDLTTLGKIIGGGLPVGAYGGRAELMDMIAPLGPVYQAGTLSGNPLAMAAGIATLRELKTRPGIYQQLEQRSAALVDGVLNAAKKKGVALTANRVAPCSPGSSSPAQSMIGTPLRNQTRKPSANSIAQCWNVASICRHRNMKPCS